METKGFVLSNWLKNKWVLLALNTVVFVMLALFLPIHFEENDDVAMCLIANGNASGSPDGHLVFINPIYGWLIAGLYSLTKAVEWYTIVFSVLHVLAMTCIVYVLLNDKGINLALKVCLMVFVYVFWARIIVGFQFTTTAGLLCFSGCLALAQPNSKWRFLGVGAVFIASLIRFGAAGVVGLVCVPFLLLEILKDKKCWVWIVLAGLFSIGGYCFGKLFYHQPDWKEYMAYNSTRSFIQDNPDNDALDVSVLPEGVDVEDYRLFRFFEGDPAILTHPKLKTIEKEIRKKHTLRTSLENLGQLKLYRMPLLFLFIEYVTCILLNLRGLNKNKSTGPAKQLLLQASLALAVLVVVLLGLGTRYQLKNRVFLCILLPMVWQMAKSFPYENFRQSLLPKYVLVLSFVGIICKYGYQDYKVIKAVGLGREEFNSFQFPLIKDQSGIIYPCALGLEYLNPFDLKDIRFRSVGLGWSSGIPFQKGVLESHRNFIDSGILWFGRVESPPWGIAEAIERNYGIKSHMKVVKQNDKYALFLMERL